MSCREISVSPAINSIIPITAVLEPREIAVAPDLMQIIPVQTALVNDAVVPDVRVHDSVINVDADLVTAIKHYTSDVEFYDGEYEATPKTDTSTQVFATQEKMMRRNFLVYTIPTREEYNQAGGVTFVIGEDYGS